MLVNGAWDVGQVRRPAWLTSRPVYTERGMQMEVPLSQSGAGWKRAAHMTVRGRQPERGFSWATALLLVVFLPPVLVATACARDTNSLTDKAKPLLALTIDLPRSQAGSLPLTLEGWGMDLAATEGTGIDRVDILDGGCGGTFLAQATYGTARPDVARQYGVQFTGTGWRLSLDTLHAGDHHLAVRLHSAVTAASACETVEVTIPPHPLLSLEAPRPGSVLLPFRVAGWAVDLAAASGSGVERVEVLDGGCEGVLLGQAEHGIIRGDVAVRYGHQFREAGWELLVGRLSVGEHVLGVQLHSTLGDASVCQTLTVSVM